MKWLQFILSHSIFISICAFGLGWQAFLLLHIAVNWHICWLLFFATLSSYNFYWLISKFHFSNRGGIIEFLFKHLSNSLILSIASIGFLFVLNEERQLTGTVIIAVLLTLLYSIPLWPLKQLEFTRKAGFLKTILLAFTWSYVTVAIPAQEGILFVSEPVILLFIARFLFMLMLCIIFDSRDITVDKIHALRSLATDVSSKLLSLIMLLVFTLYITTGFILRYRFDDNAQVTAFFITGILTLITYRLSLKKQGYFFYYFLVDGLMLFSAAATYVATI